MENVSREWGQGRLDLRRGQTLSGIMLVVRCVSPAT